MLTAIERRQQKEWAIERLRAILPKGIEVYYQSLHYSRSGLNRSIQFLVVEAGKIVDLSSLIAKACEQRFDVNHGGVICQDSGHDVMAMLGLRLYNDHSALLRNYWKL